MQEKSAIALIFDVFQKQNENVYSLELGEIALQLFDSLEKHQKQSFRGKFSYMDGYEKQDIEITKDTIELSYMPFQCDLTTSEVIAQDDYMLSEEELNETLVYDDIEESTPQDKLSLMYEHDLKPYMRTLVTLEIDSRVCYSNITHYHQVVSFKMSIPKEVFNFAVYEDYKGCMHKITDAYFDLLLKQGKPLREVVPE